MKKGFNKGGYMARIFNRKFISAVLLVLILCAGGYYVYSQYYSADTVVIGQKNVFSKRYVYFRGHMNDQSQRTRVLNIMTRAATAGYNGVVLEDFDGTYKWGTYAGTPTTIGYRTEIQNKADSLGMDLIVQRDINNGVDEGVTTDTIEAFPVVDTKFLVSGTTARATTSPAVTIPNAGFENWTSNTQPANWNVTAATKSTVAHSGTYSAMLNGAGNGEVWSIRDINNLIAVEPHKDYEVSFWIKTVNVTRPDNTLLFTAHGYNANADKESERYWLRYANPSFVPTGTAATKDWTQYKVTLNSLDSAKIRITIGAEDTSGGDGTWYIDDLSIQEVGLRNTVRRLSQPVADQLPVVVKSNDGTVTYIEGSDYVVGTELLTIPAGSRIASGQTVKVSWYQKTDAIGVVSTEENYCHELYLNKINTDTAHITQIYPNSDGFFINIDEQTYGNWDPSCKRYNTANPGQDMTGVQYIDFMLQKQVAAYKQTRPSTPLWVWNDMYDPYHNAVPFFRDYNGDLTSAISGVPSDINIMNWNLQSNVDTNGQTKIFNSLKFFSDRGFHQVIAGYYDTGNTSNETLVHNTLTALESAASNGNIDGYMYTTWGDKVTSDGGTGWGDYTQLEAVANYYKSVGRWGGTTPPPPADTTPPALSAGSPSGTLAAGTTTATLNVATNENATCKYGTTAGVAYASIPNTFATTGALSHSSGVTGLANGTAYTYYVRCQDTAGNIDASDYVISFSVAPASVGSCTDPTKFKGEYFANMTLAGTPTLVRCDDAVNFSWGSAAPATSLPADLFSARWTKTVNFTAGNYTFTTVSDDGVKLWLDGNLLIDNWTNHSPTTNTNTLAVTAGNHTVKMEYYENAGDATAQLSWAASTSDTIAPTGTITINSNALSTTSKTGKLYLTAFDNTGGSGMGTMRFSNNGSSWTGWINYAPTYNWNLTNYGGTRSYGGKTVYAQFKDNAGNVSPTYSDGINYIKR